MQEHELQHKIKELYVNTIFTQKQVCEKLNISSAIFRSIITKYKISKNPNYKRIVRQNAQEQGCKVKGVKTLTDLEALLNVEDVQQYYITDAYSKEATAEHFNITLYELDRYLKAHGISKTQIQARLASKRASNQEFFNDILARINITEFAQDFNEGMSTAELRSKYNLTEAHFYSLQHYYSLYKPKQVQVDNTLKAKGLETFAEICTRIDFDAFKTDYYSKMSLEDICIKYSIVGVYFDRLVEELRLNKRKNTATSTINIKFGQSLMDNCIKHKTEYILYYNLPLRNYYRYDFQIDNILLEIDPTFTHTVCDTTLSKLGRDAVDLNYHQRKSQIALENGYRCIHIWDWDNKDKIIESLKDKTILYARKLTVKEVPLQECNTFLNKYHFQNTCKGQLVRLGLYLNNNLVQVMTFGSPRYNKKYQWELLRLCIDSKYKVVGGAEKLFKHFIKQYNPDSIISYCDNSKFTGEVYTRLGFTLKDKGQPSKHWYNDTTKQHFTDNLVRQRGVDQLLGTNYGKGTSNDSLLLQHKFLPLYDCGQSSYVWKGSNVL